MKKPKVVVVMPAHNAALTLTASYKRLPHRYIDEVILVDDASTDQTSSIAKKMGITVFRNALNLGYGGNLKVCLTKALERKADIVIEYHPDNQYDPKDLPVFLQKAKSGYDFALGSRFIHPQEALHRKMPLAKFIANRTLSYIDTFVLGVELSEFHSGFRMYTRKLLTNVPFLQNSDDYLFSFEIIVQAVYFKFSVAEVQIACDYHPQMHTANLKRSSIYAIGTFKTLLQYIQSKFFHNPTGPFLKVLPQMCPICRFGITRRETVVIDAVSGKPFSIYYCVQCQIGFTTPQPADLSPFYPKTYYSQLKTFIYSKLQYRRPHLIKNLLTQGSVLDIGCGDGTISYQLGAGFSYTGIETPFSKSKNPRVKLIGIEGMHEKPNSYHFATFWESFEHLAHPVTALKKAFKVLKKNGYLIIECPRYNSWERLPFGNRWFHLDPPRHLFHYSQIGLINLLDAHGFQLIESKTVYAPEYIPIGFAQSILFSISPKLNVFAQQYAKKRSFAVPILLTVFAAFVSPFTYLFYLLNGSPIQLIIANKR